MTPLRIFISHKMPTDTPLAMDIGAKLALYAGNQVIVNHAGKFRYGERWRERIEKELDEADWLIFLLTDPDEDWGFCLFECGYFRGSMESCSSERPSKKLITFCRKEEQISDALKEFNALVINEQSVTSLLEDIYFRPPWQVKGDLDRAVLAGTAGGIVKAFLGTERVEQRFDMAPSLTFEMLHSDEAMQALRLGRIPSGMPVTGTKDWQRLFGRDIDTGGWIWQDLVKDWPYASVYEYLIAKMISDALDGKTPKGTMMRSPESDTLFRLTLRRYERMGGSKYRFHFTAAPVDLPFELPDSSRDSEETVLYHLLNVTWYFRRRIVEQIYERILQVLSIQDAKRAQTMAAQVYDALGRELMQVAAQCFVRGLDNPLLIEEALAHYDPEARALMVRSGSYARLQEKIFACMQDGVAGLRTIADALHEMALYNYDFYNMAAKGYAGLSEGLRRPRDLVAQAPAQSTPEPAH